MFRPTLVGLLAALASLGASYQSENFAVEAPTAELAQRVARHAEHHRKDQAVLWLGKEMPAWSKPCPLRVTVTANGTGGATSFAFDRGQILSIDMHIEGPLDKLLASALPHEVTHTVFAEHFRCPVPRWADEGGSILSEDSSERSRHDALARQILDTPGRAIPLRRLFQLRDYPRDVMALYAEGYSVTRFLVTAKDRATFLAFVKQGMDGNRWDEAARKHYGYDNVEALEQAWAKDLHQAHKPGKKEAAPVDRPALAANRAEKKAKPLSAALLKALQDRDAEVRKNAASALAALGAEVVPALIELLQNEDAARREAALAILHAMAEKNYVPQLEDALPTLAGLLDSQDVAVRRSASRLIATIVEKRRQQRRNLATPVQVGSAC